MRNIRFRELKWLPQDYIASPEKHLLLLYWLHQSLWLCRWQHTGKFFKRLEYHTTWPASWEICIQVKKQQLELDMEQQTGSKLGKEHVKTVYCHPTYLIYMQSVGVQPQQVQEYPRDEWRRQGRRQTHTEGCMEEKAFLFLGQLSFYRMNIQFSHSVVSASLWPHGLQHARLTVHHQLPELTQTHVHRVGDAT